MRPTVESVQPPWWTAVPLVGKRAYEVDFGLRKTQEVWLLIDYPGDADLRIEGITLYHQVLSASALAD